MRSWHRAPSPRSHRRAESGVPDLRSAHSRGVRAMSAPPQVQTGGPVGSDRRYIERPADTDLPKALREGALCALFAPRQEGKTSLMLRTSTALTNDGIRCAFIDLGMLSPSTATSEDLFDFLHDQIATEIGEEAPKPAASTPSAGFVAWISDVAKRSEQQIVLFIDEIHQMLEAPALSEELLQALRVLHERRARTPELKKLSTCVAGVARPRELVRDQSRNPFDVGTVIRLEDFTLDELKPLRDDFAAVNLPPDGVDHIFAWTNGQPFMTAKLTRELLAHPESGGSRQQVDRLVQSVLLDEAYSSEHYLADARLLFDTSPRFGDVDLGRAIEVYRRLLKDQDVREADVADVAPVLILSGIAAGRTKDNVRRLQVRNKVIAKLFDEAWLDRMEVTRRLDRPLQTWLAQQRSHDALLRGPDLESAVAIAKKAEDISREQRELVLASIEADAAHRTAKSAADASERARELELARADRRRMVRVLIGVGVLAVAMTISFTLTLNNSQDERAQRAKLEGKVDELTNQAKADQKTVEDLQSKLESATADVQAKLDAEKSKSAELERNLATAATALNDKAELLKAAEGKLANVDKQIATIKATANDAVKDADAKRFDALAKRDHALSDLAAAVTAREAATRRFDLCAKELDKFRQAQSPSDSKASSNAPMPKTAASNDAKK
ncbi:MAG TPA: AAA-like domain-containing protein [Kofleriaceae bacterium]|nr:AAA-like domain-containing protein [Kofleriaceae bacterium]